MYLTGHNLILHGSWQCMCKISLWSVVYILKHSTSNLGWISNSIEILLVGRVPDLHSECWIICVISDNLEVKVTNDRVHRKSSAYWLTCATVYKSVTNVWPGMVSQFEEWSKIQQKSCFSYIFLKGSLILLIDVAEIPTNIQYTCW